MASSSASKAAAQQLLPLLTTHLLPQSSHLPTHSTHLRLLSSLSSTLLTQLHTSNRHFSSLPSTSPSEPTSTHITITTDAPEPNVPETDKRAKLTPKSIVEMLDKHIIGQAGAKRAVAIAMRNRWRRSQIPPPMRDEITPKNILMIGPTGCGKTEIARRLAKIADAPFIKVEATKYTELGYVGRDVDEIIKDLVEAAITMMRTKIRKRVAAEAAAKAEAIILEYMTGAHAHPSTLQTFRDMYRMGGLDAQEVEINLPPENPKPNFEGGMVVSIMEIGKAFGPKPSVTTKMKVSDARAKLVEMEVEKHMQSDQVVREAIQSAEQDGIVFIDEIDKIVQSGSRFGEAVSSEGVQRDLLPIIEGSVVPTKYGNVSTDHMLFICSGAFHSSKPADMLAELQGRLPIRVELKALTAHDFYRIMTEPEANMCEQHRALLATEGMDLKLTDDAIHAAARIAEQANAMLDSIGARRLHTVWERILSDVSFGASKLVVEARAQGRERCEVVVDEKYVMDRMTELLKKRDLSKFVL